MIICKECGVELEDDMQYCPLCGKSVHGDDDNKRIKPQQSSPYSLKMTGPQKKFTWEIVSLILLFAIAATLIIDFIINKKISWSEYPAAISLVIFSYVSLFAFWQQRTLIQIAGGFVVSSIFIIILDALTGSIHWAFRLGTPLLFAANMIAAALITIINTSKYKGINLIAWTFVGAALLCICIDGILSYYQTRSITLTWSVIVCGGIAPVVPVLLFVHYRLKKGRSLKKTFHI